jgi:hypothetical protein
MCRKYRLNFIGLQKNIHLVTQSILLRAIFKHSPERYDCLWQDLGSVDAADPRKCQPEPGTAAGSHHDGPRT